jgi:FtsP/CotA-like multicopper oxidase with cupredoxin domain
LTTATFVSASATYSNTTPTGTSLCAAQSTCIPFAIDVTRGPTTIAGFTRDVILVNGTVPGPALNMKVGECVDFVVYNNMDEATSVHFHGISQKGTPWSDGTPGLSQYSIQPGEEYMYRWTADAAGTYFYHAHYKGQMMDGLIGAIVIQDADDAQKPFSQIQGDSSAMEAAASNPEIVFISDWSRLTFAEFFAAEAAANVDIACPDAITLNGLGQVYCPGIDFLTANAAPQVPRILNGTDTLTAKGCIPPTIATIQGPQFNRTLSALPSGAYNVCTPTSGKNYTVSVDASKGWKAFSFINSGGIALLKTMIDNHKLYVYEYNGNYIVPQVVDQVKVANGERVSFLIKLDQTPGNYQIRVANDGINQVVSGYGTLSYSGVGTTALSGTALINYGGQNLTTFTTFAPLKAAPFPPVYPASSVSQTFIFNVGKAPKQPNSWVWTLSGSESYNHSRDDAPPLLFQDPSSIPNDEVILKTQSNTWVDLIIKVVGPLAQPHPMHKHANKFFMIGAGIGNFTYSDAASAAAAGVPLNLNSAPYLDGFTSLPAEGNSSWMIFRYKVEDPGAWFLHCHVQSHFSGGMAVALLDGIDNFPIVPSDVGEVCPGHGQSGWTGPSGSGNGTSGSGSPGSGSSGSGSTGSGSTGTGASTGTGSTGTGSSTGYGSTGSGSSSGSPVVATPATYTGAASTVLTSASTALFGLVAALFIAFA